MKKGAPHIAMIGCGKLGSALHARLTECNYRVLNVYTKTGGLRGTICTVPWKGQLPATIDLVFVACADDQMNNVFSDLIQSGYQGATVHVSGNKPLPNGLESGVFYPLQTFAHAQYLNWSHIPIFVEASTQQLQETLSILANHIGGNAINFKEINRDYLHIAAVFANNFTNHILGIVEQLSNKNDLNPEWFNSLIKTTLLNAQSFGANSSQTGPASRGDQQVVEKQLSVLQEAGYVKEAEVYRILSMAIQNNKA